jgi:hypothetical protein
MTDSELIDAITVHGRRERALAASAKLAAAAARTDAGLQASRVIGPGSEKHAAEWIRRGEVKAQMMLEKAARHQLRAETAEKGYLLWDQDERADATFNRDHHELIQAARVAGLLSPAAPYPDLAPRPGVSI